MAGVVGVEEPKQLLPKQLPRKRKVKVAEPAES
jgi:hypothetical protein